ncbi:ABC transporter permease subunit [Actinomadura sp. ATCC 31491]|uniref:ABC transporter permease subunit n=1 Tax=Actinomadura luzonensis TaxID=2805427 RepID=A0ABT0FSD7_9ACTN|nr:ABC transporter permease subunit [Actinomadura luzonensis]MCK2215240.1 ABC transporter permease subunit [Actinomadura luzonensis]
MTVSRRRVRAIIRKELHDYRRNSTLVLAMAVLPVMFVIPPLVQVFTLPPSAATALGHQPALLYMLGIPVLVPAAPAAYAVVGERLQGTLEPVLTTPISRAELLLGKALAALVPSLGVAYGVFALFLAATELFAHPAVAAAFVSGPGLLAQLLFTPPLALSSIWIGITVSARARDPRVAGQVAVLLSLPGVAVTTLVAYRVIPATPPTALVAAAALLLFCVLGWRTAAAAVGRERLLAGAG